MCETDTVKLNDEEAAEASQRADKFNPRKHDHFVSDGRAQVIWEPR